jgi:GLPGLI family protein
MRKLITTIYLFGSFAVLCQTSVVENLGNVVYERVLNFNSSNSEKARFNFVFSTEFSVYSEIMNTEPDDVALNINSDDEYEISLEIKLTGSKHIVFTDFQKDSIFSQHSIFLNGKQRTYIVEEKNTKPKWTIHDEYKTINNIELQKATGLFRGRYYTAWFAFSIPINGGPWKLNGLPGLILYVADSQNEVVFNALSFTFPCKSCNDYEKGFSFSAEIERIPLLEYRLLKEKQAEEVVNHFVSRLPRGAVFSTTNIMQNELELEYE